MSAEALLELSPVAESYPMMIAHEVCRREWRSAESLGELGAKWEPADPAAFVAPIALQDICLKKTPENGLAILRATFYIGGEKEMRASLGSGEVANDFDMYGLELFHGIYAAHAHLVCLRTLRLRRQEHIRRERIRERQREIAETYALKDECRVAM